MNYITEIKNALSAEKEQLTKGTGETISVEEIFELGINTEQELMRMKRAVGKQSIPGRGNRK